MPSLPRVHVLSGHWMKGASATMPRHCKHRREKATMPSAILSVSSPSRSSCFFSRRCCLLLPRGWTWTPFKDVWCGFFTGVDFFGFKRIYRIREIFVFCSCIFLYIFIIYFVAGKLDFWNDEKKKKKFLRGKTSGSACFQWIALIRFYFDNISTLSRSL